ncbi:VOC family protein [Haloplanus halophilus]|uniref:VOC family protein n=1 Tax=Haloplanus halophilus TaxID=2949993 RepID=UPI0020413C78|nr:VOC family protein [Haloplanus sp. GDY1]
MFEQVHHVAYTVDDLDSYRTFFGDVLEMEKVDYREMPEDGYKAAVYDVGGVYIEVQEPMGEDTDTKAEMEEFLEEQGNGLNHVAYEVDDIAAAVERLETEKGIERDWDEPIVAPTFPDCKLIDMEPDTSRGIYLQLVEELD